MKAISIGPELRLPLEAITSTFAILAVRGAGKSNLGAVMAEGFFEAGLPFVVIDPVGAWWGLRSSADGKASGLEVAIFGGRHGDLPLGAAGGGELAEGIAENRLSCVVDVSEFSQGDKIRFLADFAERLYRKNAQPLHLFLEEADDYAPQTVSKQEGKSDARLLGAWQNIVRRGRQRGLGITMITQRSAVLNKNVLTQIETLFVLRTTAPQDRKAIGAWLEYHGQAREVLESLSSLKAGEAWVWSPQWLSVLKRIQVPRRRTFDSGATPKDVVGGRAPATLATVDLAAIEKRMAAAIERAKADDPRELKRRVAELERQLAKRPAAPAPIEKRVEVPILTEKDRQLVERILLGAERLENRWREFAEKILERAPKNAPPEKAAPIARSLPERNVQVRTVWQATGAEPKVPRFSASEKLAPPHQRILDALAELVTLRVPEPERAQVALLAGYTHPRSKGFVNALGALRTDGFVDYRPGGRVFLTEGGWARARWNANPRTSAEIQERVLELLDGPGARILRTLIEAYPRPLPREDVAARVGYEHVRSKGFVNALGRLRSLGFVEYQRGGQVAATSALFFEEAS